MYGNPLEWRWVNELGMHNAVDARELVEALLDNRMTPHVWVWRTGWKTWLRASQVAELACAIPKGARLPPVSVDIDPEATEAPPIPRYSFRDSKYVRHASTPIPAPHLRQLTRKTPTDPPGAVPSPPRTFENSVTLEIQRAIDGATFASDNPTALSAVLRPPNARPQGPSLPDSVPASDAHFVIQSVLGEPPRPSTVQPAPVQSLQASRPGAWPSLPVRRRVLTTGISFVLLAACAIVWLRSQVLRRERMQAESEAANRPRVQAFCRAAGAAERIAPNITLDVPLFTDTRFGDPSLAVGFADDANSAAGILVDPISLSVKYAFRQATHGKVANVVPQVADEHVSFVVSEENDLLREPRPVRGSATAVIGHNVEGFVRQVPGARAEMIWPTDIDTAISGARLVALGPLGLAMTYRQGGLNGSLWIGWLTPDGHARAAPVSIQTDAKFIGEPSVAASGSRLLVSFAGRVRERDHWRLHLASIAVGAHEASARVFETPAGGTGGDSIAPSVVGLDGGRFLLQWSEGGTGHWQVRLQNLDEKLQPWGPSVTASPTDVNAAQGIVWLRDTRAVSLFVVNSGHSAELWAAPLDCPR